MEVLPPWPLHHLHYSHVVHHPLHLLQQKQLRVPVPANDLPIEIRQVWRSNIDEEFLKIHTAVQHGYRVFTLDTEFPGAPYIPDGVSLDHHKRNCEENYKVTKMNVEKLKIIQVGITLTDQLGNLPHFGSGKRVVWEFNFSDFDANNDECSKESVALLKTHGIDFELNRKFGIKSGHFAFLMLHYGLIGPRRAITWITFQGGADLAYLLKMFLVKGLPNELKSFNRYVKYFFGVSVFDVKHIMTYYNMYGGLDKVASNLKIKREAGESHRAGSDSLLTNMVFQRLRQLYFPLPLNKFAGKIHKFV